MNERADECQLRNGTSYWVLGALLAGAPILFALASTQINSGTGRLSSSLFVAAAADGLLVYCFPLLLALNRKHPHGAWIAVFDLFLGWTLIGWLGALLWAYRGSGSGPKRNLDRLHGADTATQVSVSPQRRLCPYCGQELSQAASVCDSCGSDLRTGRLVYHDEAGAGPRQPGPIAGSPRQP
ncbi:MAG TPA: superinfection immunity protein [Nevskiaceae bacterium]|nr:superinfection immunity protein [Nevskiaceae bacterium]